jgi:LuxR family maltose regulon positive regulatory protein
LAINARCAAASAQIVQGKLSLAAQTCREAIDMAGQSPIPPVGLARSILGQIALERYDLRAAEQSLGEGLELSRKGGLQDDLSQGLVILARLQHAQGDLEAALATVEQGTAIVDAYDVPRITTLSGAYKARIRLAAGHTAAALLWAKQYRKARAAKVVEYVREFEDLTLARILLATGDREAADAILSPVLERARAGGRVQICIEALVVQVLSHWAAKNAPAAVDCLAQALHLAAPEGFARIFLDEGEPLLDLLSQARSAAPQFVDDLVEEGLAAGKDSLSLTLQLPEPLTVQEQRVLGLLGLGMSNREIADELVISLGTAKWHVHNLLQKLDVENRMQAVVRARELGIA